MKPNSPITMAGRGILAMSLGEMLLTLAGVTAVLTLLMTVTNSIRSENADQQTRQILRSLRLALDQYHAMTQTYPPQPFSIAIHYLQRMNESESYLHDLRLRTDRDGFSIIDDGYGRPLRYLQSTPHGQFQPDFVSAGPDGWFGDLAADNPRLQQAILDNVYGSDVQVPQP